MRRSTGFAVALGVGVTLLVGSVDTSSSPRGDRAATQPLTFSKDVAPLIFSRCGGCHRPDGPAPFSLLTYAAVRQRATQIALVTKSRFMPPWKSEPGYGEFIGKQPLTDEEIALIGRWIEEGSNEGDPRELPPVPQWRDGWQLGTPDLSVRLSEPYSLKAEGDDVFRTFVLRLPISATRYVRGLEFRPGNTRVIHHANILIDRTATSRSLDDQQRDPGYEGGVARSAEYPAGHFPGWTPGEVASLLPKGLEWRLEPGTDLVIHLHMQPSGKPELVDFSVGLFFGSDPPTQWPAVLRLGDQSFDIPAGDNNYTVTDSYVLPVDVKVQAVYPHAHRRARTIRGLAILPNGTTKWLILIKDWDSRWQHIYRYVAPFVLPKGTTLTMQYTYDNSAENPRNPDRPPRPVGHGWLAGDEMGDLWIQVLTRDERDHTMLTREFRKKFVTGEISAYEALIEKKPLDIALHEDAALLNLELGRYHDAIRHFEASVQLKPHSSAALFNLGTALRLARRFDEAIRAYRRALRIMPEDELADQNLSEIVFSHALQDAQAAVRAARGHAGAHNTLGSVLMLRGDWEAALPPLREALRIDPDFADAHYNLGHALEWAGELAEAVSHLRQAVRLRPDETPFLRSLAWTLATAPVESLRDAEEAIRLAERAADLTERRDAEVLNVLAAAYAAAGSFDRALDTTDEAIGLAPTSSLATAILSRQDLYRRQLPYRSPSEPGVRREQRWPIH